MALATVLHGKTVAQPQSNFIALFRASIALSSQTHAFETLRLGDRVNNFGSKFVKNLSKRHFDSYFS